MMFTKATNNVLCMGSDFCTANGFLEMYKSKLSQYDFFSDFTCETRSKAAAAAKRLVFSPV